MNFPDFLGSKHGIQVNDLELRSLLQDDLGEIWLPISS